MDVLELVEIFNNKVIGINRPVGPIESDDEKQWLVNTIKEEMDEYCDAVDDHDFIGQIDAMIDLIYFAAGGLVRMGVPADVSKKMFEHVHNCNMQKHKGKKDSREKVIELDAFKPEGWVGPEEGIAAILSEYTDK